MTRFPVFAGFLFVSMYVVLVVFAFSNTGGLTSAGVTLLFLPLPFFLVAALTSSTPELRRFFLGFGIPLLLYAFIAFIENTYPSERPFLVPPDKN